MTTIVSPKLNKRLPVFVEEKDIKTLFDHVAFSDDWKGRTEKLVMQLFYSTGMRLSELIGLKESQLDASLSQIKVLGKGNKERIIPISQELVEALQTYIQVFSRCYYHTEKKSAYSPTQFCHAPDEQWCRFKCGKRVIRS
jgi:integrase/recombinase XerC